MNHKLLVYLQCPFCNGNLSFTESHANTTNGKLECASCNKTFDVKNDIPRFASLVESNDPLKEIKQHTQKNFGFEWQYYNKHGFEQHDNRTQKDIERTLRIEKESFFTKALFENDEEFKDKLVLDAGCGNGRYIYQATQLGAEVIGIDISSADVANNNLKDKHNVHIIQGDLHNLPFKDELFDRIFSIGVLMHTGDAEKAFYSLCKKLKRNGIISIHVYKKGNFIYEFFDRILRKKTLKMELEKLLSLSSKLAKFGAFLSKTRKLTFGFPLLFSLFNCFIRLEGKTHNVFDWYSAPIATHHTYPEVYKWFENAGIKVTKDRNRSKSFIRRILKSPASGVTVKGIKL